MPNRCWVHTMQHLMQTVPPPAWPAFKALGADLRDAPTFEEGQRRLPGLLAQSQATVPAACRGQPEFSQGPTAASAVGAALEPCGARV